MRTTVRLPAEGVQPHHDPTFHPVVITEVQILVKPLGTKTGICWNVLQTDRIRVLECQVLSRQTDRVDMCRVDVGG